MVTNGLHPLKALLRERIVVLDGAMGTMIQRVVDDVGLRALVYEINFRAARIARQAADRVANETGQQRFVGGSMGPLPVAGSISPDVNDPAFRAVSFDQLRQTYFDEVKALLEGGVDLLIVETIFDTLNGKAALF